MITNHNNNRRYNNNKNDKDNEITTTTTKLTVMFKNFLLGGDVESADNGMNPTLPFLRFSALTKAASWL